jgi:hypothetical protein
VTREGKEKKNMYRVLLGKSVAKKALGRPRHRRKDNIKMYFNEIGCSNQLTIGTYGGIYCPLVSREGKVFCNLLRN